MDPLTVLGLASNVVQLVDAAANAFTICHEIYKMGSSIEDSRVAYTSDQLYQCYHALNNSLKKEAVAGTKILRGGVVLQDLGLQCCETASALHAELESLRKSPSGGFRETVSIAIMRRRKAKKIAQLKARLDEYQRVLDSGVLVDIRQGLGILESLQDARFEKTDQQLAQLSADLAVCRIPVSDQLKAEIEEAIKVSEKQHQSTRKHIETHVTSALRDLETLQSQERTRETQARMSQQIVDRFLKSLTFDDINLRMNEIVGTHPKVFEWIFDEEEPGPWDSFATWLRGNEHLYWINGKAGSGKSTLMKFIASDSRTIDRLMKWSPDTKVLVVTYYFWSSGSKLQRSMKGFLCSVIRQFVLADNSLLTRLISMRDRLHTKSNIGDWSSEELQQLLTAIIDTLDYSACIFIDGLDEFDQRDDIDNFLDLIDRLSVQAKVKLCLSSRPEHHLVNRFSGYRCLRLQDLTAKDLRICIQSELEDLRTRYPEVFDEDQLFRLVEVMTEKADGVFLWVHFVLQSVARGIRKEDNFGDLLSRIEDLPSEMQELYSQMWRRLNGDERRYRQEAAEYFTWIMLDKDSMSLFELWVVLDTRLQDRYLKSMTPQNPANVIEGCERLRSMILTRCAGLLEIKITEPERSDVSYSNQTNRMMAVLVNNVKNRGEVQQISTATDVPSRSRPDHGVKNRKITQPGACYEMKIGFIHRTARDFLIDTEAGEALMGTPTASRKARLEMRHKAKMAVMIQGLEDFSRSFVSRILLDIAKGHPEQETKLLILLKKVCETLNDQKISSRDVSQPDIWGGHLPYYKDFVGYVAFHGRVDYIRHFVENEISRPTSTYLAYLFICATIRLRYCTATSDTLPKVLSTISYLTSQGADLFTWHHTSGQYPYHSCVPVLVFLLDIIKSDSLFNNENVAEQIVKIVQQILPSPASSTDDVSLGLSFSDRRDWECEYRRVENMVEYLGSRNLCNLNFILLMEFAQLCDLVMRFIETHSAFKPHWIRPTLDDERPIRVTADIGKENSMSDSVRWKLNDEDSQVCGRALWKILSREVQLAAPDPALVQGFLSKLHVARQRSLRMTHSSFEEWLDAFTPTSGMNYDENSFDRLMD